MECKPKVYQRGRYERVRRPHIVVGESMTDQSYGIGCDINVIFQRFARNGGGIPPPTTKPVYADVRHLQQDLRDRLEYVERAFDQYASAVAAQAKVTAQAEASTVSSPNEAPAS